MSERTNPVILTEILYRHYDNKGKFLREVLLPVVAEVLIYNTNKQSIRFRMWDRETGEFLGSNKEKNLTLLDYKAIQEFYCLYGHSIAEEAFSV